MRKLMREQRKLSRKEKGSGNRNKQRVKVALVHEKITNQRKDFLQKQSTMLIRENQTICIEDLKVKNMMRLFVWEQLFEVVQAIMIMCAARFRKESHRFLWQAACRLCSVC